MTGRTPINRGETRPMPTPAHPLRVFVAGAPDAPLTHAAVCVLRKDPRVRLVGIELEWFDDDFLFDVSPDLLISACYRHLIKPRALSIPRLGTVGLHPALLPRYRGSWPLWWALRNGEREAGVSLYALDEHIDTGPILLQARIEIRPTDTFTSLYARAANVATSLTQRLIDWIAAEGQLPAGRRQDEALATTFRTPSIPSRLWMKAGGELRARRLGRPELIEYPTDLAVRSIMHTARG